MKKRKIGLILYLIGLTIIFTIAWIALWFTSPIWSSAPPEHFDGTAWEVGKGINHANCLKTFFAYDTLLKSKNEYKKRILVSE